jgi:hypothetical protein
MSRLASKGLQAAAGAAGGGPVYVDDVFSNFVYQGNNSTNQIVNGIDLAGEGGLVWQKARSNYAANHLLTDTVRGRTKYLSSNLNAAEATANDTHIASFNNDGFTLGGGFTAYENFSGITDGIMSWTFRKQPGFFDVVTYTGDGGSNRAISHNLDSKPGLVIIKATGMSAGWMVGTGFTSTQYYRLALETSGAASGGGLANYDNYLSAEPTTTTFSVGNEGLGNANGQAYVAYLFANDDQRFGTDSDEAIIKCGSYTGNGSSTGPTVNLGFEPQWLLIKKSSGAAGWYMYDNIRGVATGGNDALLYANGTNTETNSQNIVDFTATGFQIVNGDGDINANAANHIYVAIRRPHKPASEFAATALFGLDKPTSGNKITPGFPADFGFTHNTTGTGAWYVGARLTQGSYNDFSSAGAESSHANYSWDSMTQFFTGYAWADYMSYGFRRAPGFFDVVTYTGTNSATTIPHNLGVAPEMIFVKNRGASENWQLYLNAGGTEYGYYGTDQKYVGLNTSLSQWNNTSPTDSVVSIATGISNASYSYVMYLFASVPGISKIGTYTGTGSELTVDCGFSAGARFVLIKRVDNSMGSGGESYFVFDTVQGITASSSPYLTLSDTDAPVTGSFIKPDSSGFKVTSQSVVNTNGSTYVFYAIA